MDFNLFGKDKDNQRNDTSLSLLSKGWRPLRRDFDWRYFGELVQHDTQELTHKTINLASYYADALGRRDYTWWANILNVFSNYTQSEFEDFWNYITPEPLSSDHRYQDVLSTDTPIVQFVSRDSIPIDYVLKKLQETTVLRILELLGRPNIITQYYLNREFYYPVDKFISWEKLDIINVVYAYWSEYDIWLQINCHEKGQRCYTLTARNITPIVNKANYNLAVILSGYQSRVGRLHSQFPIRSFPADICSFTDIVQQAVLDQKQLAVLVHGEPGTGKTVWTQAVAKEVLVPLGYVIFILDHDALQNFVPPTYLERICIIINEADNLAQSRDSQIAQANNKTEHILSLLDGTLYQSVIDEKGMQAQQSLVILMTCNTTERLDPAMLRKGRIDLMYEFTQKFV